MASLEDDEVASHRARIAVVRHTVHPLVPPVVPFGFPFRTRFAPGSKGNDRSNRKGASRREPGEDPRTLGAGLPRKGMEDLAEKRRGEVRRRTRMEDEARRGAWGASSSHVPSPPHSSHLSLSQIRIFDASDEGGGGFGSPRMGGWDEGRIGVPRG